MTSEDPMTKPKSKTKTKSHKPLRHSSKIKSPARPAAARRHTRAQSTTKNARIVAMLRAPAGATNGAMMSVTNWQQHSVRGFLAGIVRKKLGHNLVSQQTDKGRIYRIEDAKAPAAATRAKQASQDAW